ncbi:DCN1-like protein 3 [Babylonia areolata]|uniref:DCN1-like protein 3 n=1 Tax=Babylonia areolata TaxID=304850 RepID=UPI003FD37B13
MTEPRVCKFLADIGVFTFKPKLLLAWTFNATEGRVFPKEGFLGGIRRLGCDATIEALRARCSTLEDEAARAADDEDDDFRSFYRFVFRLLTRGQHDDVFRTPKVSKVVALEAWEAILPLRFVHLLPDWKAFLGNLPADLCFNESDWEQFLACRYPKSTRGYLQSVSLGVVDDFIVDLRKARVRAVIERIEKLAFFGDM